MAQGVLNGMAVAAAAALLATGAGAARAADGAALYATHCIACHQADGEGTPGLAPPLAGTLANRAKTPAGRDYFAQVLVSGMVGTIATRAGKLNGNMPTFSALADADLAAVLGHVLVTFNQVDITVSPESFAAARARALPPGEVSKLRSRVIKEVGE